VHNDRPSRRARRRQRRRVPARGRGRGGLDRAVEIFQLLHAVRKPIPIGEIARRLKAPRSTIYEIVNLFLAADILEVAGDDGEVFFGRAVYLYANDYFVTHGMVRLGQEEVRRLGMLTGETCQFCMPVGNKYTVVAMQNSARLFRIGSDVGVLVPIPWTASGRFFVAHMTLAEMKAFIPAEDFRTQNGRAIDPRRFLTEAKKAREAGICAIQGLVDDYATCIAAPVVDPQGRCTPVSASSSQAALEMRALRSCRRLLKESAQNLSAVPYVAPPAA
jgi:DNA-binding IclR family transcriptional regulator